MQVGRSGPAGLVSTAHVELRLAGTFRVVRDGTELTDGEIGSRKSRTLLKLLAVERPGLVPLDRIVDVLWPGERPAAPEQNIATLVSRLRAVLGTDLIQGGRAGYRLAAGAGMAVDLDAAARFCDQAEGKLAPPPRWRWPRRSARIELLSAGTAIADEPYADWADAAREQVRELLRRVRLTAAEAALATGRAAAGGEVRGSSHGRRPVRRGGASLVHVGLGRGRRAGEGARAYEALRQRLGRELGTDPAPQTRDLHLAILRDRTAASTAGAHRGRRRGATGGRQAGQPAERIRLGG